jgi:hypothetical protein
MQIVKIPKKTKGAFREICIPSSSEKARMREYLPSLNAKAEKLCNSEVVHGFMNGKSPVTNALKHIGYQYTLKFDLSDFFDTVTPKHLKGKLTDEEVIELMPDNRAYQGLPTSPVIANLAAKEMDEAILKKIKNKEIVYTRYADDMCFSFNDFEFVAMLKTNITQIVGRCGFRLNKQKTWLQDARYGKRHVTGVAVDSEGISASRSVRRRLRAALHQKNHKEAHGLAEWVKLKVPNPDKSRIDQKSVNALCRQWKIPAVKLRHLPKKRDDILLDNNIIITGDPIQMLGMSNFTTGWTSCMAHPHGQYHRRAPFWTYMEGTLIAGMKSEKTLTVNGFTRPLFSARALIHEMGDGKLYFDRVYYDQSLTTYETFVGTLNNAGINHIGLCKCGVYVKGGVDMKNARATPYLDSLYRRQRGDIVTLIR